MIESLVRRLRCLHGSWQGRGSGNYPTIDPFEYEELLRFELDERYPMLHYEQRTWLMPHREPSHWESGFVRPLEDGTVEISNSQDSGRVEVLRGRFDDADQAGLDLRLELDHVVLDHDPRLHGTRRIFEVHGDVLRYVVYMATHTTPAPRIQQHLEATLHRGT